MKETELFSSLGLGRFAEKGRKERQTRKPFFVLLGLRKVNRKEWKGEQRKTHLFFPLLGEGKSIRREKDKVQGTDDFLVLMAG